MKEAPKISIFKKAKSAFLLLLILTVIIESVMLYRLYKVNVAKTTVQIDESGELFSVDANLQEKIKNVRKLFRDSSADAWARARKSDDPEDAWFSIGYRPRADFRETSTTYLISVDVPGVKVAELSASLNGSSLTINGVRNKSSKSGDLMLRERFRGEFSRTFELPGKVEEEGIKADLVAGILRISIPKGDSDDLDIPIPITTNKLM